MPDTGWVTHQGISFTLRLPTEFRSVPVQGIDSEVGMWRAVASEIGYDYGMYSATLTNEEPERDRQVCDVEIGGRRARLVTGRHTNGQLVAAAHWPAVTPAGGGRDEPAGLTIFGTAADSAGQRTLLASLWTVQFR